MSPPNAAHRSVAAPVKLTVGWLKLTILGALMVSLASGCGGTERPPVLENEGGGPNFGSGRTSDAGDGDSATTDTADETETSTEDAETSTEDIDTSTEDTQSDTDATDTDDTDTDTGLDDHPGPFVEVLNLEEDEIIGEVLPLLCSIETSEEQGAFPLDVTSIQAEVRNADGDVVLSHAMSPGEESSTFEAEFVFTTLDAGQYSVGCVARDSAPLPAESNASTLVLFDKGPTIAAVLPLEDAPLSAKSLQNFQLRITPTPLFDGDEQAGVEGDPVLTIDGVEFLLSLKDGEEDVYWVDEVDFSDPTFFDPPPSGSTRIAVHAANERGVIAEYAYSVVVDSNGPQLTLMSPTNGSIVGNELVLSLSITDDLSGVDWSTLKLETTTGDFWYDTADSRWARTGSTITFELDTSDTNDHQFAITGRVDDLAGNASLQNVDVTYHLDQKPPVISLTPPVFRAYKEPSSDEFECSHSFDPVGDESVNHGELTSSNVLLRALTYDRTNSSGQEILWHSKVAPDSFRLWLAPAGAALVIDSNNDQICDNVETTDVNPLTLYPLTPTGAAFFGNGELDSVEPSMTGVCGYAETPLNPPMKLCDGDSDLSLIVSQNFHGALTPAVYTPLVQSGAACTGQQQSLAAIFGPYEGWVCAAVRGYDQVGNRGVSAPIAFCMDNLSIEGSPDCSGAVPDCSDGCTPLTFEEGERYYELP